MNLTLKYIIFPSSSKYSSIIGAGFVAWMPQMDVVHQSTILSFVAPFWIEGDVLSHASFIRILWKSIA